MPDGPTNERCSMDDVIDVYKRDVDRTLLREMLKLTPAQRLQRMVDMLKLVDAMRAGMKPRSGIKQ